MHPTLNETSLFIVPVWAVKSSEMCFGMISPSERGIGDRREKLINWRTFYCDWSTEKTTTLAPVLVNRIVVRHFNPIYNEAKSIQLQAKKKLLGPIKRYCYVIKCTKDICHWHLKIYNNYSGSSFIILI